MQLSHEKISQNAQFKDSEGKGETGRDREMGLTPISRDP